MTSKNELNDERRKLAAAKMEHLDEFARSHDTSKMTQKQIAAATGLTIHAVVYWRDRNKYKLAKPQPVKPPKKPRLLFTVCGNDLFIVDPPFSTTLQTWQP